MYITDVLFNLSHSRLQLLLYSVNGAGKPLKLRMRNIAMRPKKVAAVAPKFINYSGYSHYNSYRSDSMATTVAIAEETRDMLKQIGSKGQTYDEIIKKLIQVARREMVFRKWDKMLKTEELIPLAKL